MHKTSPQRGTNYHWFHTRPGSERMEASQDAVSPPVEVLQSPYRGTKEEPAPQKAGT